NTVEYVFGTVPSVVVGSDSIVRDNYIDSGGGFGVDITSTRCRVQNNHIVRGTIRSTGTDNIIIGNTVDANIVSTAGDFVGPQITSPASMTTASRFANIVF
ncbi:MAG: hypothetical protein AAFQ71_10440, partial [Planctomycetota bacterium]